MNRMLFRAWLSIAVFSAVAAPSSTYAQQPHNGYGPALASPTAPMQQQRGVQSAGHLYPVGPVQPAVPGVPQPVPGVASANRGYPQLNSGLYPSPVQYTPPWNGGAVITNQALAPHEMLYPHKYHAMYGPFYYKVHGKWLWTPFGMRSHEQWKLQGSHVNVKYRSHYKPFSGFHPPRRISHGLPSL